MDPPYSDERLSDERAHCGSPAHGRAAEAVVAAHWALAGMGVTGDGLVTSDRLAANRRTSERFFRCHSWPAMRSHSYTRETCFSLESLLCWV